MNEQEQKKSIFECRKEPLEYTDDQKNALLKIEEFMETEDRYFLISGYAGTGKHQPYNSIIYTQNKGKITLKELEVGDYVFTKLGTPTKVLKIFPSKMDIYEVLFTDGSKVQCCDEHLWEVSNKKNKYSVVELGNLIERGLKNSAGYKFSVDLCHPVDFNQITVPLDPYLVGLFIGNGSLTSNAIRITMHRDFVYEVYDIISKNLPSDVHISIDKFSENDKSNNAVHINFSATIKPYLKKIGLFSKIKHIPEEYLFNSIENRIELLKGLMDSGGSIELFDTKKKVSYSTVSEKLKTDVIELCRGLGSYVTFSEYDRTDEGKGIEYDIRIRTRMNCFNITKKRKAFEVFDWVFKFKKGIKEINFIENGDGACIYIDDYHHLYLTNDYTVTHNTVIAENIATYTDGVLLAPTNAAVQRLIEKIPDIGDVATIHKTIYGFPDPETGEWKPQTIAYGKTYIIDESSMIDSVVLNDLLSLSQLWNNKLIFVGDDFQLPPVGNDPKLFTWEKTNPAFKKHNKVELREVKRQDGEILKVATLIRDKKEAIIIDFSNDFKLVSKFGLELFNDIIGNKNFVVITSINQKRLTYNKDIRSFKFNEGKNYKNIVNAGELVISVANNDKINGEIYSIHNPLIIKSWLNKEIDIGSKIAPEKKTFDFYHICDKETQEHTLLVPNLDCASLHGSQLLKHFMDYPLFHEERFCGLDKHGKAKTHTSWNRAINIATYGYAITCHKCQGNEFDNVYIDCDWLPCNVQHSVARWIYTAITRGKKKVKLKYNKYISIIDEPKDIFINGK